MKKITELWGWLLAIALGFFSALVSLATGHTANPPVQVIPDADTESTSESGASTSDKPSP